MYNFILQIAIMVSLGAMIYLIARAIPRVSDEVSKPTSMFDRWFNSLQLEKIDTILSNFLEKLLRKIKLFLMRLDNITTIHLDKIKKSNTESNSHKNRERKPNLFENNSNEEDERNNA